MGYQGPAYTWSNKKEGNANIAQRLDRVLVNLQWHVKYPNSSVFHLPRFSSDHLPILLKPVASKKRKQPPFKTESWWNLEEDFEKVCDVLKQKGDQNWEELTASFKKEIKGWLESKVTPNKKLLEVEQEMEVINSAPPGSVSAEEEREVQNRHQRYLLMNKAYWKQRARIDWMISGDNNSRFFHAMAVSRKRRNQINAILNERDEWETSQTGITRLFVAHFKAIYTK